MSHMHGVTGLLLAGVGTAVAGMWLVVLIGHAPTSRWPDRFATLLVYFIGLVPILDTLLAPRIGNSAGFIGFDPSGSTASNTVARATAWLALGSVPTALLLCWHRRVHYTAPMVAMVGYGLTGLLSGWWNGQPTEARTLYALCVFFSIGLLRQWTLEDALPMVRRILRIYVWGSLALAVIAPSFAFWIGQDRKWIGLAQLAGVTTHPNGLGTVAAIGVFAELVRVPALPSPSKWHLLAAFAALIATQSRGAWVSAAIGLVFYLIARRRAPGRWIIAICVAFVGTLSVVQRIASALIALDNPTDAGTLDGRTQIWQQLIPVIQAHPIIGVGPLAFDSRYIGPTLGLPPDPSHANAHNQVLQTLVERGIIGLAFLALLAVALLVNAARHPAHSRGGIMAIVAVMVSRFAVETPLFIMPASQNAALILLVTILAASKSDTLPDPDNQTPSRHLTSVPMLP